MKIRYEWRILTDDGLLKSPEGAGPYYDRDDSICYSFDTEEAAIAAYELFDNTHQWGAAREMVLVKFHYVTRDY